MSNLEEVLKGNGEITAVLRSPDGTIDFPSEIPPGVEPPLITPGGTKILVASTSSQEENPAVPSGACVPRAPIEPSRPAAPKTSQSERPQAISRESAAPHFQRAGTNLSALNEAIYAHRDQNLEGSSSSSSEDEPEEAPAKHKHPRLHRKQPDHSENAFRKFNVGNDKFKTKGKVSKRDGRLNISVNETGNTGYLAKALGANFLRHTGLVPGPEDNVATTDKEHLSPPTADANRKDSNISTASTVTGPQRPKLNIVVMVIGSRGDIQPFLRLGKILKEEHGHRVRIATHPAFREFVQNDSGLEFFSVGGDPAELMAFMVKNPGMIPKMETVRAGEIGRRRDQMAEMFQGFWRACINATDDEHNSKNLKMMAKKSPFIADAIIANPPCFAHVHCAERLGIPLHLMFTFPYTPTQAFPHPLANVKQTNVDPGYTNFMSYPLVEMMTWQGLGDLVNNFRVRTLGLEPVSTLWAPGQLYRLKVPYTYLWSPGLVPKPEDWGSEINIAGFVFLDLASSFKPPKKLEEFLSEGDPPIYIGFGSIVVDDPDKFTKMIFDAVKQAGVRALVSKGWGGLGDDNVPDNIFMLENTPHDWLFPKVKAVVHHGGAGTTAIGLKCGKPTMIVPFFGDQQFWGSMIGSAGAGPDPVPYKDLTTDKLADGLKQLLSDECAVEAGKIAESIEAEGDGAQNAVKSFHKSLRLRGSNSMRCSILEDRVAVWLLKGTQLRLSALAACLLVEQHHISWKQLRLIRHYEWNDFEGPGEPITGGTSAIMGSLTSMATGIGSVPFKISKHAKKRAHHEAKKRKKIEHTEKQKSASGAASTAQKDDDKNGVGNVTAKCGREGHEDNEDANDLTETAAQPDNNPGDIIAADSEIGKHTQNQNMAKKAESNAQSAQQNSRQTKNNSKSDTEGYSEENSEEHTDGDNKSVLSDDPEITAAEEVAVDVGEGVGRTGEALARAPMDLTLAIAQGFHNAPRLYGDTTVRRPTRITGIKSGFKAAGEELGYGVYDGVTGIVTQPYKHAKEEGALGLVKGVGIGLTGFVLKDLAAIFGVIGYPLKGVHKEIMKHRQPTNFIRKARIAEGRIDFDEITAKEREKDRELVAHGWTVAQEIWSAADETQHQGLRGRVKIMKEKNSWKANGAFENIEKAQAALDAKRRGEPLEKIFADQKKDREVEELVANR